LDYRIADKVSLSIGTFFHYDKEINDALGIPSAFLTSKTYLYEVPLQLNYHFKDYSKKFDPFLKTTVRYSYSYVSSTFQYQEDISKSHYNNSYVLWDIGAGLNFRINKNIFLGCQLSYGLALKYTYKNFKYIEPLISLGYTFIK
jgi:outer membrane autotransporter protein